MRFKDIYFSKDSYFSIGIEEESGEYYISIPVSNRHADYEEYYRLDQKLFLKYKSNLEELAYYADLCRLRKKDEDLFVKPGKERGTPI